MPDASWPEETAERPEWNSWDPVMLTEYLSGLDPRDPNSELVLEIRRGVLDKDRIAVDLSEDENARGGAYRRA